jgi:ankyrin repeat protein/V8-like Glu-specific endopeptidase
VADGGQTYEVKLQQRMARHVRVLLCLALMLWLGLRANPALSDAAAVTAFAKPAVVFVHHRNALGQDSYGTGFIVFTDGYVITCAHVIASTAATPNSQDKTWVRTSDGSTFEGEMVYCDSQHDVALLHLAGASNLPCLQLERSARPAQGEEVVVLGYPLGPILGKELVVTRGIVSAFRSGGAIFQLDAAVNPGCSGGPVLSGVGRVVGIAWAKLPGYEGMNFAMSAAAILTPTEMLAQNERFEELIVAAENGDAATIESILSLYPGLLSKRDRNGRAPLQAAVIGNKEQAVQVLLSHGANVNTKDNEGWTALHIAASGGALAVVRLLIKNGANVTALNSFGNDCSEVATRADVLEFLLEHGVPINGVKGEEYPPLNWACVTGCPAVVRILLRHGADVSTRDRDGDTPLHNVCGFPSYRAIGPPIRGEKPNLGIMQGAASGVFTEIAQLLIRNGAMVNAKNKFGRTPLHLAAMSDKPDIAVLLVSAGARVNAKDSRGNTPLSIARQFGNVGVRKILRQHGAK